MIMVEVSYIYFHELPQHWSFLQYVVYLYPIILDFYICLYNKCILLNINDICLTSPTLFIDPVNLDNLIKQGFIPSAEWFKFPEKILKYFFPR